jgi:hypothetical protein
MECKVKLTNLMRTFDSVCFDSFRFDSESSKNSVQRNHFFSIFDDSVRPNRTCYLHELTMMKSIYFHGLTMTQWISMQKCLLTRDRFGRFGKNLKIRNFFESIRFDLIRFVLVHIKFWSFNVTFLNLIYFWKLKSFSIKYRFQIISSLKNASQYILIFYFISLIHLLLYDSKRRNIFF